MKFRSFVFLIAVAFVRMLAAGTCDVLVVGGGAAGIAAALQAGRSGASVILVERGFQVGGNMTTGGVNFPGLFHAWGRQVIDGCAYEVLTNAAVLSGEILPDFAKKPQRHWMHQLRMDIPVYVALAEEALVKAGVRLRYHMVPMNAVRTGDCWFLKVVSDGVVDDISATVLIDCTGDGTLAEMAGARRVRESETSPGSFMYDFANGRELWARCDRKLLEDAFREAIASGELHPGDATFGLAGIFEHVPGTSWNYLPGADASTAEKRADTNRRARESMLRVYRFLKRQPGFGNLRLGAVSPEAAVRETWRVEGDYVITADDYVSGRTFEDGVCHAFYPVDLHSATDGVAPKQLKVGVVPSVPFRALCAKGVPNLLVAGRCVSGDRLAVSGLRVQAACMATGQAAGEAAALAASRKCDVRDVSVDELRRRLSASGAIVPSRSPAGAKDRVQVHSVVTNGVEVRWFEEMVPMRDGVRLYTVGLLPPVGEKRPIVFEKTPYDNAQRLPDAFAWAWKNRETLERGYAPVHQQARGTDRSEGVCLVYENERRDGLDALEWIRRLPHYNGEIFLYGGSYCASVHWSYLDTDPPDVKGAWLAVQDVNRYNIHFRNGNFKIALQGAWSDIMYKKNDASIRRDPSVRFTDLPLKGYTVRKFGEYVPGLETSWEHPRPADPWWQTNGAAGGEYRRALLDSHMPVMLATGFYDIYTEGIFDMWRELPSARRANCALVVDEGDHVARHPDIDSSCAWFDHCRGVQNALRLIRPGRTTWREVWGDGWQSAEEMTDGGITRTFSLGADRSLSEGTVQDGEVAFAYDPSHPPAFSPVGCLTFGGRGVQPAPDWATGVVSFVSRPFDAACHVQGRMRLRLAVRSDCEDTAFYVRMSIWRNGEGRWYNLRDDIKTICWDHPDYRPGTEVNVDYQLSDHAFAICPGDRIRVDVAGASPAQFVPHTNYRGPFHEQQKSWVAHNAIVAGRSRLALPMVVGGHDKREGWCCR